MFDAEKTVEEPVTRSPSSLPRGARWIVLALAALFFLLLLPIGVGTSHYHRDEQFYTDAALQMMATGDYLTPRAWDGAYRFQKPILTYWAVVAGYRLAGVSMGSGRIFFLLAGALLVAITLPLGKSLFGNGEAAVLASLIVFSNNEVVSSALRTTPDVLLCLGITLSLLGFARVLFADDRSGGSYALAYGGIALAVSAKGLLPLTLLGYVFLFAVLDRRRSPRELLHAPAMLFAAAAAVSWYAMMISLHGPELWGSFFSDQVGERLGSSGLLVFGNLKAYFLGFLRDFLPWTALLLLSLVLGRHRLITFFKRHRRAVWFVVGWYLVLFVVFSGANITRTRYFLPAFPLLATLFAALLVEGVEETSVRSRLRYLRAPALVLVMTVGLAVAGVGWFLDSRIFVGGVVWTVLGGGVLLFTTGTRPWLRLAAVAAATFFMIWTYDVFVRPVFAHSPAPELVASLESVEVGTRVVSVGVDHRYLAQIRVVSRGSIWPRPLAAWPSTLEPQVVIAEAGRIPPEDADTTRWDSGGVSYRKVKVPDIWSLIRGRTDRDALFQAKRRNYLVSWRKAPADSP